MTKLYEVRDPIYGFIEFNDWEKEIINHPVFQRLRRIRQLGLTDMVYPGAVHTRFEHSLGVMHVATKMFDKIINKQKDILKSLLNYTDESLERDRAIVRLAALLHDLGHPPFSHAGEGLMPVNPRTDKPYKHEDYSAASIELLLKDIIENHPLNKHGIKANIISDFLRGTPSLGRELLLWRDIIISQLDADRADYLLRDSHHIGVAYGRYDLDRILVTILVNRDPETGAPILVVEKSGGHAVEGLILARYMMFTQVYFQHTRRIFDYHAAELMKFFLKESYGKNNGKDNSTFPSPSNRENLQNYLGWCDCRVWGYLIEGKGGEHGERILKRDHYRRVHDTPEVPNEKEIELAQRLFTHFKDYGAYLDRAESSWYKLGEADIPILTGNDQEIKPLSEWSTFIGGLKPINQLRVYVTRENSEMAKVYRGKLLSGI